MGELSPIHWLIVLAVILLLFGGRKIPELAKGLKEGRSGAAHTPPPPPPPVQAAPPPAQPTEEKKA
jgi:sec-independent protein translocase protein TatA